MIRRKQTFVLVSLLLIVFSVVFVCCENVQVDPPSNNIPVIDTLAFTDIESSFIQSADTGEMMRVFLLYDFDDNDDTVSCYSDSIVLREVSKDVTPDSTDLVLMHLIYRLHKTVLDPDNLGVGIAASQVGVSRNVIWVMRDDKPGDPYEVYLNPKILQFGNSWLFGMEGCLSVPNKSGYVRRATAILLQYDDLAGEQHIEMIEAYTARIFQHEIDHLNGVMYIDHLD